MEQLPSFPLFPNPLKEKSIIPADAYIESRGGKTCNCGVCGRQRDFYYDASHYSEKPELSEITICPWCIADGSAAALGITFNDATICPYVDSLPQMSETEKRLVEERTPGFVTWQGNHWLMCCERACIYLGEASAKDMQGRWAIAIPSLFESDDLDQERKNEIVSQVGNGIHVYMFQCQDCSTLKAFWDCD